MNKKLCFETKANSAKSDVWLLLWA